MSNAELLIFSETGHYFLTSVVPSKQSLAKPSAGSFHDPPKGPHQHPKLRLTWQPVCCNGKMSLGINITHPDLQETSGCAGLTNATNISHPSGAGLGQHSRAWSSSSAFLLIRSILLSKWERGKTTKCFYSSM